MAMRKKQIPLDTFIRKNIGLRRNDEMEEGSRPTSSKKQKATLKRKYHESYLKHGFTTTGKCHIPNPLCTIRGDVLSNEAMKQ